MSVTEDDRRQRFRFHKEDEIKLLQIVLRADPCPYKISARDGTIMVAWNLISEEFRTLCTPRADGKLPHSRTCRARSDKMLHDFRAQRENPYLRPKTESKEDKIKYELLSRLDAVQLNNKAEIKPFSSSASSSAASATAAADSCGTGDIANTVSGAGPSGAPESGAATDGGVFASGSASG
ncbi:hypothetical protein BGZ98_003516, partial [Dissophora globulifera]